MLQTAKVFARSMGLGTLRTTVVAGARAFAVQAPPALDNMGARRWTDDVLKARVDETTYKEFHKAVRSGSKMEKKAGNKLAAALQDWAFEHGCTKYAHVFYPMRHALGHHNSGEKLNTFLDFDFGDKNLLKGFKAGGFNYSLLTAAETDGSSFPNGGLRKTDTAAAFKGWDHSSPPFIRNMTLYLPSTFSTFNGESLDEKLPLLRSGKALNKNAVRLLRAIGDKDTQQVVGNVGTEQEYFIVTADHFVARPDLMHTGRTVLGASPARGQYTNQNYFGTYPSRVRTFMEEVDEELWALGMSVIVQHNEVAPSQHEWSPVFSLCNVAADQNIMAIEVMNEIAINHGLRVLLHEKPFKGINGSGKHCNWGMNTDTGKNLFVPGKTAESQASFITFVACLARALHLHGDLIRCGVANAGNDHRLGAQEAPPAIISLYTGVGMEKHLRSVMAGGPLAGYQGGNRDMDVGVTEIPPISVGVEDRNRTAPFPFCGNRFEFRAVGSAQNVAQPLSYVQAAVAESMGYMAGLIEGGMSQRDAVAKVLNEHETIIFNGDGYSAEWVTEAARRGLPNHTTSVDAFDVLASPKNKQLMESQGIMTGHELEARQDIAYDTWSQTLIVEAKSALEMIRTGVLPAAAEDYARFAAAPFLAGPRKEVYTALANATDSLSAAVEAAEAVEGGSAVVAHYIKNNVVPQMLEARAAHDEAEKYIAGDLYPFPTYTDMLYKHHYTHSEQ